jgi:hypothetical protein
MGPTSSSNQFFGVKISQVGTSVNQASDSQLIYKSNFSTNLFNGPGGVWKVMEGVRAPTVGNGLTSPQFGFWVSEDGVDVQQAADNQLVFNSSKAVTTGLTGTYTFPTQGNLAPSGVTGYITHTIPHNLGVIPLMSMIFEYNPTDIGAVNPWSLATAWTQWNNNAGVTPYNNQYTVTATGLEYSFYAAVDATNLYVAENIFNTSGSTQTTLPQTFNYYLLVV